MLKFNKKEDLLAVKWLIKAIVVWLLISEVIWESAWVQAYIADPYTGMVAWELEKILHLLGYEVARDHADLAIRGIPYAIGISPRCTGLSAGFFIYLGVVTTLPAPALRARIFWLALGTAVLTATNIFRVTAVIVLTSTDPSRFAFFHKISIDLNLLVGGVLSLLAVRSLSLKPMGIKVFKPSGGKGAEETTKTEGG